MSKGELLVRHTHGAQSTADDVDTSAIESSIDLTPGQAHSEPNTFLVVAENNVPKFRHVDQNAGS